MLEWIVIVAIIGAVALYLIYIKKKVLTPQPRTPKEPPTIFKAVTKKAGDSTPAQQTKAPSWFTTWKPRRVGRKIQIPGLLGIKRIIAGILFLVHGIFFLMLVRYPAPQTDYYAFVILLTAFILLDYLFKTRRSD